MLKKGLGRMVALYGLPESILVALSEAAPDGFTRVGDRRWVSETRNEIRAIVEFQALKGALYSGTWGFAVDFVPLVRGTRLSWKRTQKTAQLDLTINPLDEHGAVRQWWAIQSDTDRDRAEAVAQHVWRAAAEDFASVTTPADLLALFERRSSMTFGRFGLQNYVQTDLAWGLLRIANGDPMAGHAQLREFCDRDDIPFDEPILGKAIAAAQSQAMRLQEAAGSRAPRRP